MITWENRNGVSIKFQFDVRGCYNPAKICCKHEHERLSDKPIIKAIFTVTGKDGSSITIKGVAIKGIKERFDKNIGKAVAYHKARRVLKDIVPLRFDNITYADVGECLDNIEDHFHKVKKLIPKIKSEDYIKKNKTILVN